MTKRIFRSICFAAVTVFVAALFLIMGVLYGYFSDVQQEQLIMQLNLAAQGITNEGMVYFRGLEGEDYRITWIDQDGTVLFDSEQDIAEMENHMQREEVKEAVLTGYGESRRYSATLTERSLYAAKRLSGGTIVRLSISQRSILALWLGMGQPVSAVFAAAVILSVVLAIRLSGRIVEPLDEIDLDAPLSGKQYEELMPFLRRIDSQQQRLLRQKAQLEQRENELHTIIGSMKEGMILADREGRILSINHAARKLLDAPQDCIGLSVLSLCRALVLREMTEKALSGEAGGGIIGLQGERYQINASPVLSGDQIKGAAVFFFNVTEKEKEEQLRREFTANVSHELKTPLHAVCGYAELLKNDMVRAEDRTMFAARIYEEAQRMVRLVEDIINLSRLDEGAKGMAYETVDLYELAHRAIRSLEAEAAASHITFELTGEPTPLTGIPPLLYSIIYNLCDNGIRYNHKNGTVTVRIQKGEDGILLSVQDSGIGIAPEHRERIFERFYRVDKSHSRETGGTGLGLSIVKHAAMIHHAAIEVGSVPGHGTVITVRFPGCPVEVSGQKR